MILHAHIKRHVAQLHGLHQRPVRRQTGERKTCAGQRLAIFVVELVAVAVALGDLRPAVAPGQGGAGPDAAGIGAQAQRAALVDALALAGHEVDDLMGAAPVKLTGVGVCQPCLVPGEFDDGHLHAQADAQIGEGVLPGVLGGENHALNPPVPEAARYEYAGQSRQFFRSIPGRQCFRIYPADVHMGILIIPCVTQGFGHREIGVLQLGVFPHKADGYLPGSPLGFLHHDGPLIHLRICARKPQPFAHCAGEACLFQHQRRFIQASQRPVFDDALRRHIAKQGDFLEDGGLQRRIAAQHDDVRVDAHALQLLDAVLGGLGLVLIGAGEKGDQRHMDEHAVLPPHLQRHLPRRLQEGLTLNIPDSAADLGDDHVSPGLPSHAVDKVLDLIGDVGNDLHRGAQVFAPPLLVQHVPVDLAGGEIGKTVEVFVDEALIVAQVQVGLRAVLGDENLPVLIGAHGAGVHVDVRVQLLRRDLETPGLQKPAKGRGGDPLAQSRHHAAGDKDVFGHAFILPKKEKTFPGGQLPQRNVIVQHGEDTPGIPVCQEYVLIMFSAARRLVIR